MKTSIEKSVALGLSIIMMAGCSGKATESFSPTPTLTVEPSDTPSPGPSEARLSTPTATFLPTGPDATQALDFDVTPVVPMSVLENPVFGGQDDSCRLPCWHGLRIGVSRPDDVQHMFDTVFEFNGAVDMYGPNPQMSSLWIPENLPDAVTTGYYWTVNNGTGLFDITLVTEKSVLSGIVIDTWHKAQPLPETFRRMGNPDEIFVSNEQAASGQFYLRVVLLYRQGITVEYNLREVSKATAKFCLDQDPRGIYYLLLAPFQDTTLVDVTALQNEWVVAYLERFPFRTIKETTGLSPTDFVDVALSDSTCLQFPKK